MNVYDIIKKPVVTEKTELLRKEYNKYTFEVHPKANKIEIKKAIETIFSVAFYLCDYVTEKIKYLSYNLYINSNIY